MSDTEHTEAGCAALKQDEAYFDTKAKEIPALNALFEILAAGTTPTFLDIMSGISEMVAFHTDHDQISGGPEIDCEKMSGKKCLFCS